MSRDYFILWYRLDGIDAYLIWFNGEQDGVVIDEDGKIPCFLNIEGLLRYADSLNLSVAAESPILHDFDIVASWLKTANVKAIYCKDFLAAWNLFDDISRSVDGNFDTDQTVTAKIYDKLFWGNNLPSVTPAGQSYHPAWTKRELTIIRETLASGLLLFRQSISCA